MGRKKISGQTITIIVLVVLLILVIGFGGVYAYYSSRSNKVSGTVVMANLKISLSADDTYGASGSSNLIMTSGYVMPGQSVKNNALTITNDSNGNTFIVVIYKVEGYDSDDLNTNVISSEYATLKNCGYDTSVWTDYHFTKSYTPEGAEESVVTDFWCLVGINPFYDSSIDNVITVVAENCLIIPTAWGNEFQDLIISFSFQAYAIGAEATYGSSTALSLRVDAAQTNEEKCDLIVSAIWTAFDYNIQI